MIAIIMLMVGLISDYGKSVTLVHSQGSSIDHIVHNDIKWHYVTSNTRMFCQCPSANRGDLPSMLVVAVTYSKAIGGYCVNAVPRHCTGGLSRLWTSMFLIRVTFYKCDSTMTAISIGTQI